MAASPRCQPFWRCYPLLLIAFLVRGTLATDPQQSCPTVQYQPAGAHRRSPLALHAAPLLLSCCLLLALIVGLSSEPHPAPHLQVWAWGCPTVRLGAQ